LRQKFGVASQEVHETAGFFNSDKIDRVTLIDDPLGKISQAINNPKTFRAKNEWPILDKQLAGDGVG
jgi:hypothetical protein